MIKVGQIYKEKELPEWRKNEEDMFIVTNVCYSSVTIIYPDGKCDYVVDSWIKEDCDLIAEYQTWQEAVNSEYFKND